MNAKRVRHGFTLVEFIVVLVIIVLLGCLLIPAKRVSREAARRNTCLNNIKQINLAVLTYEDSRKRLPLASTTYFNANGESPSIVGTIDDGYSWLFQLLPHVEQQSLYDRTRDSAEQLGDEGELGPGSQKLTQGPFVPQVVVNPKAAGAESLASNVQIEAYLCPSFPGAEQTKDAVYNGTTVAVGTYVAIPSTHYNVDGALPGGVDEGDFPDYSLFGSYAESGPKRWAGNGVLVFAQRATGEEVDIDGKPLRSVFQTPADGKTNPRRGPRLASVHDGTSNTILFTESREERYASWISGLSAYVVAADPRGLGQGVKHRQFKPDSDATWLGWDAADNGGRTALNVGFDVKRSGGDGADSSLFYDHQFVHADGSGKMANRWFGPSSAHPGTILHGFADGHGEGINEDIDREVYLHLVTRAGGEEMGDDGY